MSMTRRSFLQTATCVSAGLAVGGATPTMLFAAERANELTPYLTGMEMASTPATLYRAYRSKPVADPETSTWVQIDLGTRAAIDAIRLFPASERMYPGRDQYYSGEGFPLRFRIEASDDPGFGQSSIIVDLTRTDFPDPVGNITQYDARGARGRYVRLTATHLRPVKVGVKGQPRDVLADSKEFTLTLAKVSVIAAGRDIATGRTVTADAEYGNPDLTQQLTRQAREDGEQIYMDRRHLVTDPSTWKRVAFQAEAPRSGVTLEGGIFETTMRHNIAYLLNSYSTSELLRQFYERTGEVTDFKPTGTQVFWEEDLAGSNAGRFLMGAGNTIRWIDDPALRRRLNEVVDGIEECRESNGYIMAYPADTIFYSERAAYTRAWLTHGLLEAAYAGNAKALPMLRGYYDWFNRQPFLPRMLRGAIQGGQGMIANTRVCLSPAGKPDDALVIQRYYQEDAWLAGLARREKEQVWQYPYDRPHCYLLTDLEAYLDMYLATGDTHYHDAVLGAWQLYRDHWQQAGGSISIIEFEKDPPDSNYLQQKLGELCGSSFWVFLSQRFQLLHPDEERYAGEIEKSIYNIAIANQDGGNGLRYHTILEGAKEEATHHNTCCEGQGTRLIGSLPEHIYSIAADGVYVNLFEPSTLRWQQAGQPMTLQMKTHFPFDNTVQLVVGTHKSMQARLRIRVPSWAGGDMRVSVNGSAVTTGQPGTYLSLNRNWADGDKIEFTLPASIRVNRYRGADQIPGRNRFSIEYGPVLLAAVGSAKAELAIPGAAASLVEFLEPVPGAPLHFTVQGNPDIRLMPYWQVADEQFTCYPAITSTMQS